MVNLSEELNFWTDIMCDHSEFIILALSPREMQVAATAQNYKMLFINLKNEVISIQNQNEGDIKSDIINRILGVLLNFINFKRVLLQRLLQSNIEFGLPPTFVNHMINEAFEFYRTLCMAIDEVPVSSIKDNLELLKIWVPDASGHAASITSDLDPIEESLINEAEGFKRAFDHLNIKVLELYTMLERVCLKDGALIELNKEAALTINAFMCFLQKIKELTSECRVLGVIKPLIPEHMMREEKHFLDKLEKYMI